MRLDHDAAAGGGASGETSPSSAPAELPQGVILLFAVASGLAVANAYFAHPLLDIMADDLGMSRSTIGAVVATTQLGYGLGLVLLVPLGDLIDRRKLVVGQSALSVAALLLIGFAASGPILLAAMALMGLLAVVTQGFVAYAAALARPDERGRVVGTVTSGIVLGILLARVVSGALADISGWRSVYFVSACLTLAIAAILFKALPPERKRGGTLSYPRLILSLFALFRDEPVLRIRAIIAMLIFAGITTLLTPMALALSAPPFSLSHTAIGLFGLAGAAGALGAARAGRWVDRGHGQRVTGVALALMLFAWLPIGLLPHSILWLVAGVVIFDFGLQAVHVTNQGMIYRVRPEAQSRLTAGYMAFYSIGSAIGSWSSTLAYARAGWTGVSLLGAGIAALTIIFWAATLKATPEKATTAI